MPKTFRQTDRVSTERHIGTDKEKCIEKEKKEIETVRRDRQTDRHTDRERFQDKNKGKFIFSILVPRGRNADIPL